MSCVITVQGFTQLITWILLKGLHCRLYRKKWRHQQVVDHQSTDTFHVNPWQKIWMVTDWPDNVNQLLMWGRKRPQRDLSSALPSRLLKSNKRDSDPTPRLVEKVLFGICSIWRFVDTLVLPCSLWSLSFNKKLFSFFAGSVGYADFKWHYCSLAAQIRLSHCVVHNRQCHKILSTCWPWQMEVWGDYQTGGWLATNLTQVWLYTIGLTLPLVPKAKATLFV